jgi:hypothetical protein
MFHVNVHNVTKGRHSVLEIADIFVPCMILFTFSAPSTHCPSARSALIIADLNLLVRNKQLLTKICWYSLNNC